MEKMGKKGEILEFLEFIWIFWVFGIFWVLGGLITESEVSGIGEVSLSQFEFFNFQSLF
jgi:hypothetical protein